MGDTVPSMRAVHTTEEAIAIEEKVLSLLGRVLPVTRRNILARVLLMYCKGCGEAHPVGGCQCENGR